MTDIIDVAEALFLPDTPRTRTALYRFYSSAGILIYLGITLSPPDRFANHRRKAEWWPLVDESKTTIEWFSSRPRARQHELRAIQNEHPIFNKEGALAS